ncbi:hypothetical protein LCGC14_2080930 [marine sediment metagenome]|uniref:Uncharacterized protein n=1 Tax=marine sediment metagenome TaxID=412755 RepID=A0A0F9HCL9_9ZZZZ
MVDLNKLQKFLRPEMVKQGSIVTFVDAGNILVKDFSKKQDGTDVKDVFEIKVRLPNGDEKIASPNKTSLNILQQNWGEETKTWVGKRARIHFSEQLVFCQMKNVMVFAPEDVVPGGEVEVQVD